MSETRDDRGRGQEQGSRYLTKAHAELRRGVRGVCARFPNEYWRELDARRRYPEEFVRAMSEAGYLAALVPEEYGGMGLDLPAACAILEEVNRSGANAGPAHAQMYTMGTLLRHGSERQKREYLPRVASGELRLQAFAVTEPEAGTDTASTRTTASREGDHYVVNGSKIYISRVEQSDLMILLARTTPLEEVEKRTRGLSVFLVDLRDAREGLTVEPRRVMMNNATNELLFENVRVPAQNLIGEEGEGFRYILDGMNAERILIAAEASWEAANVAMQTFGGYGFDPEYDVERKFRETRLFKVAPISTNLILSYLAEHVLGLPRSF